ncbi:MAG: protein kinase [Okeania sp. SIO3I5]|uniref:serine/threonine-protein kinase n=1 Tax=Okeania sp. SIO3I5 TaxID=2607805 RepID=UPI0013B70B9A|nr:serine/threonine-protein kinase [Okeania sp. SIO3I5]NEQ40970.1 protein kinase [Okeania sp. SIO3I5]
MSYCLNLHCQDPQNPNDVEFCQTCGSKLLLRGHYQAIKPIGNGSFGRTLLAVDLDRFNTPCVIKQFSPQNHSLLSIKKGSELFKREAEQLLKLGEHPQVPTFYAYFEEEENLFLVEELITGKNLLQELSEAGAFSEQKIWKVLYEILPLLKFIHENEVIHRDIKPENILRVNEANSQQVGERKKYQLVLIDFGVSKLSSQTDPNKMGTITGTLGYAPIEQIRGGKAYPASDLYSLGMTCIHLLTGVAPNQLFDSFSGELIWRSLLIEQGKKISYRLEKILDKLVKDLVKERYQSATELLIEIALVSSQNGEPKSESKKLDVSERNFLEKLQIHQKNSQKKSHLDVIVQAEIEAWKNQKQSGESADYRQTKVSDNNEDSYQPFTQKLSYDNHLQYNSELLDNVIEFEQKKANFVPTKTKIRNYVALSELWKTVQIIKDKTTHVNSIAIDAQGFLLVSGSDDKIMRLWNLQTGQLLHKFLGHTAEVYGIAISADGRRVISGGDDRTILVWNLQKRRIADRFYSYSGSPYSHRDGAIFSVAISPDGETVASGSADHTIKIWNQRNGELLYKLHEHLDRVFCVTYSKVNNIYTEKNDGQIFASCSADGAIKIWQVGCGKSLKTLRGHSGGVYSVAFSSDGEAIASGGADKTIKLWDVATGELVNIFEGHSQAVLSVVINRDDRILASGSIDGTVKLWSLQTGKLLDSLCGYHPVQFSPDGKILVSGGEGGRMLIWRL